MPIRLASAATFVAVCLCIPAHLGQANENMPLAAIDWLSQNQLRNDLPGTILKEPPATTSAAQPEITVTPLKAKSGPIGLVSAATTGLPVDLWGNSAAKELAHLIHAVKVDKSPAMQALLFTLLLSETHPPTTDPDTLLLAQLDRLMQLGAPDPAQALAEQAGPTATPARFQRWFDAALLTGDEDLACAALAAKPFLAPNYAARIFCSVRRGDWSTGALTLETAYSLELLPESELALLDRFLNPDIFEDAPPLPKPRNVTPLEFRLFESIGEALPTPPLPRAFAAADLRGVSGWKAQIEAAERLTHIGALNPNQLLGLYTERKAAASGGVWERVAAIQDLDNALNAKNKTKVAETLQTAWHEMQAIGIEIAFADLFSTRLAALPLEGSSAVLAWHINLLSADYEVAAENHPNETPETLLLSAIASGDAVENTPTSPLAQAINTGFNSGSTAQELAPKALRDLIEQGDLGEAILEAMMLFQQGAQGNSASLSQALATFRLVGLEDTARRAALQLLILKDE
ncbi:hypothetical protein [Epibacterium ulvae]|uniref:hypothetical protein n=1 Tax=Epibacterium ulvae TaxID=1156985 RepID=UPI002493C3D7|nr:hypothetical protein [Epibacterium ulvae]